MSRKRSGEEPKDLKQYARLQDWTPETLRATRLKLGLTQKEIASVIDCTPNAISFLENGRSTSPWAIHMYGIILERYWAGIHGYVPAFRKIGENTFMEETNELRTI